MSRPISPEKSARDALLLLDNQLCFRLYTASRLMNQAYRPALHPLGLTYPQYLVLLVLWENDGLSVKKIGERLRLDSATLTQILKNMEKAELITRTRVEGDARTVLNHLTPAGRQLRRKALRVPETMACSLGAAVEEAATLLPALQRLIDQLAIAVDGESMSTSE